MLFYSKEQNNMLVRGAVQKLQREYGAFWKGHMDNSLNQLTYERLKKDILTFTLKPGDTVSAEKVAKRYEVSRTPARESLVKLETEGLVDIIPQSKSVISKIDLNRARQEWFVRKSLEMAMLDKVFENVKSKDITRMKKYNDQMLKLADKSRGCSPDEAAQASYEYLMADNAFHEVTYEVAGESLASSVIANTRAHYSRLRFLTEQNSKYRDRTLSGHSELIAFLKEGDKAGYRKALTTHLDHIIHDIDDLKEIYPDYFI